MGGCRYWIGSALMLAVGAGLASAHMPTGGDRAAESSWSASAKLELVLARPIERAGSSAELMDALVSRLVWRARRGSEVSSIRSDLSVQGVRIEAGRVVGSSKSRSFRPRSKSGTVAEDIGASAIIEMLSKCCDPSRDGPLAVRAISGDRYLESRQLAEGIVDIAERALINGIFVVKPPMKVDWRTQSVVVLSVEAEDGSVLTRPLILVLARIR